MYYQIVSFNYKKCSLEQRESVAFKSESEIVSFLKLLTDFDFIAEAFVLNTCNRVEIITATKDNFATFHAILGLLSKFKGVNFYELEKSALRFEDKEAIEHFFKVIAALDSMVIGESQITGQVKEAFKLAYNHNLAGRELNRLISYGIKCAAEIRQVTDIGRHPVSIASVAVAQAEEILGSLSGMVGVVIGTGEMGKLAAKHLLRAGADVLLISRDKQNAVNLAEELGENVKVGSLEKLPIYVNKYRLLFSATSSKEPVITKNMIENKNIKRLWFDMAIPRDIDEEIKAFDDIEIYYIDDLKEISQKNHALRAEKAYLANEMVKKYKEEFLKWLQALSVEPVIKQIRLDIKDVIAKEVKRNIKKGYIPKEYKDNIEYMVNQVFDKYLHLPTKNLRELSKTKKGQNIIDAVKLVFNIDTDNVDVNKYK